MELIYLRTSTDEQSPENQLADVKTIAPEEAVVITETESAYKENHREKFNSVLKLIKQSKVKDFYVWDLDRIYRNRKKLIEFFELCKVYNCRIHSFRQNWLEDLNKIPAPFNEMMHSLMVQLMGWLGEEESNKKSERIKNAVRNKGGVTISYKGNKWGRKAISSNVIQKVLELAKEGKSVRIIAKEVFYWDKNNNQKNLSKSAVHKILAENKVVN